MSPYLYRRLMREKVARLRPHASAPLSDTHRAHSVSLLTQQLVRASRHTSRWN